MDQPHPPGVVDAPARSHRCPRPRTGVRAAAARAGARRAWLAAALVVGISAGCSGGGGSSEAPPAPAPAPPQPVAVQVTPAAATISTIQTQAFAAVVLRAANPAVTWRVDGIVGGNATVGTISAAGLYTPSLREATHAVTATSVQDPTRSGGASVAIGPLRGVLTYHNDNMRSGQNPRETLLTPSSVASARFGRLGTLPVDGYLYATPLVVADVPIAGRLHDVVFVATEHNSVYAFDADGASTTPLWQVSFNDTGRGVGPVASGDTGCDDITPEIGVTSTPVIDPLTGTLYVVAMTSERGSHAHRLHALDIRTGNARPGSGRLIEGSVPGTAAPNDGNGRLRFSSLHQNQRAALLLSNNVVYVGFASFCDLGDYHGWLLAYDATSLQRLGAFSTTPDGTEGGIWQSGGGPAAGADGELYVITADGSFDAASGGSNHGNSFLRLAGTTLAVSDYFTPFNQSTLEAVNADLGSGGAMLLPDQPMGTRRLVVGAGKQGMVYLLDRDDMGRFQVGADSQIVQSFPVAPCGAGACPVFATPAYFDGKVYLAAAGDRLRAFALRDGRLAAAGQSATALRWPGATAVVSANGLVDGVVWTLETNGSGAPAVLRANAADDVSIELFSSARNPLRDEPGRAVKFSVPTVVGGRVYVGSQGRLVVYGLQPAR